MSPSVPESPSTWGPRAWTRLHAYAARYPVDAAPRDAARAMTFLRSFWVPCEVCHVKFQALVRQVTPADLRGRETLFEWTVKVHNMVNMVLHKPLMPTSEAKKMYGLTTTDDDSDSDDPRGTRGGPAPVAS